MIPLLLMVLSLFPAIEDDTVLVREEGDLDLATTKQVLGWHRVPAEQVPPGTRSIPNVYLDLLRHDSEPLAGDQWALSLLGVDRAWEETSGQGVLVAVIDSGLQMNHPDLVDRIAINAREIPGNGVDDDGNGLVDDVLGWDVIEDDSDPTDPSEGHGTEVAGVLAASLNGEGIAGLAPAAGILPIRACTNRCELFAVAWAITYAVDRGADIINLSLGGFADDPGPLADAVDYAEQRGVLIVTAAGNSGMDIDNSSFVPASLPNSNLITVTATDRTDSLWSESNFGAATVDLAAPGVEIVTTTLDSLGTYRVMSGTSFAAPHAAATAALMLSVNPTLTPPDVAGILGTHGTRLDDLAGKTRHGRRVESDSATVRARLRDIDGIFEADIVWLAREGITRGCNPPANDHYCPDHPVTRAEMAAFLRRARNLPEGPDAFTDDGGLIFEADINALSAAGISRGCNPPHNDRYCPHRAVSRAEMAAFLTRALALPDGPDAFTDDDGLVFEADINALAAAGISRGCNPPDNDRYCPSEAVSRAEMAAFLRRALR